MADLPFFKYSGTGGGGGISGVSGFNIDENGYLHVTYDDGRIENLGKVKGEDGAVVVPHIDEHHVLTFTVEQEVTELPGPVDLNPNDEWSFMEDEEEGIATDYVWEQM